MGDELNVTYQNPSSYHRKTGLKGRVILIFSNIPSYFLINKH